LENVRKQLTSKLTSRDPEKKTQKIKILLQYYTRRTTNPEEQFYNRIWYMSQILCRRYSYDGTIVKFVRTFRSEISKRLRGQQQQSKIPIDGTILQQLKRKSNVDEVNTYLYTFLNRIVSEIKATILHGINSVIEEVDISSQTQLMYAIQWLRQYFEADDSQLYVPFNLFTQQQTQQSSSPYKLTPQQLLKYQQPKEKFEIPSDSSSVGTGHTKIDPKATRRIYRDRSKLLSSSKVT